MFSKYKQRCFIKIQIAKGKNARQCHTRYCKIVVERLYHIVPWLGGCMHFCRGREDVHQCHTAIILVEQSVQRLVQQNTVDGICRLPDVWRWVLHVGGDLSIKQCDCSKNVFFVVN